MRGKLEKYGQTGKPGHGCLIAGKPGHLLRIFRKVFEIFQIVELFLVAWPIREDIVVAVVAVYINRLCSSINPFHDQGSIAFCVVDDEMRWIWEDTRIEPHGFFHKFLPCVFHIIEVA